MAPITDAAPDALITDSSPPTGSAPEGQQAAFNPETGEINWACPCLGGMADGPCGPQFKEAFSCFVYSNDEPKGVECVPKFRNMQDCFRKYPDIYGNGQSCLDGELGRTAEGGADWACFGCALADDDDEEDEDLVQAAQAALAKSDDEFVASA